ncbi:endonuclease/exonuclease/phosphatase family protein [Streptomyces sp. A7024]|uniref:Endonuclease/exonuclease/phosphatase family protein n=1 Tax=Streptomyces coryli TaxID=1128680 RepID=A0A6G4UEI7_9ACTN|nr:endonuclease/exonuclease/phosphatase family protein [Streptomyces coryli]NGN69958.1 endonuclease/exonuclease/phosphatase family protein [Streptomyces coryli]
MTRFLPSLALLCAAVAGTTAAAPAAPAASAAESGRKVTLWHWNVAGHFLHKGSTDTGLPEAAVASIAEADADFASFNELCRGQYDAILTGLRAAGWTEQPDDFGRFAASRGAGGETCGGDAYGNAVFSKAGIASAERITLPRDGSAEKRNMVCGTAPDGTSLCSAHLTVSDDLIDGRFANIRQLERAFDVVDELNETGGPAFLAGDLNVQPHFGRMERYYSPVIDTEFNSHNHGRYHDLDHGGDARPGYGSGTYTGPAPDAPPGGGKAKLDYLLVREDHLAGARAHSAEALAIPAGCSHDNAEYASRCSDHRAITGTVRVM